MHTTMHDQITEMVSIEADLKRCILRADNNCDHHMVFDNDHSATKRLKSIHEKGISFIKIHRKSSAYGLQ